ncbi:unnamed protein product, partial [marine sediment metagenome]
RSVRAFLSGQSLNRIIESRNHTRYALIGD